jgi:type VI secretion system ImpM family protein
MVEPTRDTPGLFQRLWKGATERVKTGRFGVNAYGKLPIYKDFITTGVTDPAAREFRTWVDRGFSHRWSTDENYREVEIPSHSFLLRLADGKGFVAGSLWGSTDEGGLRRFPFTLFVSFPGGQAATEPLTAVDYLALIEARSRDLRERFGPGGSLASLYQTYRGASIECPLKTRDQIHREVRSDSGPSLATFAESLLGPSCEAAWPAFLDEVASAVSSGGVGAVRLPLGGALPRVREIEFWLLWLSRQERTRKRAVCGLLYPNGSGPGRVTLFFRDLRADDIFLLHSARVSEGDVRQLPTPATEPVAATEPDPAIPAAPEAIVVPLEAPRTEAPVEASAPVEIAETVVVEDSPTDGPFSEAESAAFVETLVEAEPLLLDAEGRPRLTQAPFSLASLAVESSEEAATANAEPSPSLEPPRDAAIAPEPAAEAAPTAAELEPAPEPSAPTRKAPPGWDRPLYDLLEA